MKKSEAFKNLTARQSYRLKNYVAKEGTSLLFINYSEEESEAFLEDIFQEISA